MNFHDRSRRQFLKNTAGLGAWSALPAFISKAEAATSAPSMIKGEKVNLACIGIGNRGAHVVEELYNTGLANIVALCDVDMGAEHTQKIMGKFPNVKRFQDFRKMFDKMGRHIDAVSVAIPDHAHFPAAVLAMSLGKHVYVEKPLSRTFYENELLINAAEKYKVVTQMGNQGHSGANYFQFKTWVEAGIIKDVTAITAHMNGRRRWHAWNPEITGYPAKEPIPATLDWDVWQGSSLRHDYNKDFVKGQWRSWYEFGLGALGDWGAHIIDTAHEFLNLGLPTHITPLKLESHNNFFYPMASTILFKFPARGNMPPVDLTWYDGVNNIPPVPDGYGVSETDPDIPPPSTGKLQPAKLNPGKEIYSRELVFKGGSHASTLTIIPPEKAKEMESKLPEVPQSPSNHFANFLNSCKGLEKTRSPFSVAGPLSQVLALGVIAQWINEPLIFDRTTKQITNNPMANLLLRGPAPAKGWEQFYKL
ncbi:MAG: Gfo/Idh/MocA family oxidoreductase [Chitinophagaceae bacterium]|nr:Gfo/Idh/MocA family oxidoreductase [Chitinophagaceae bacterium]